MPCLIASEDGMCRLQFKPKKHFGQNFLQDLSVLDIIIKSIPSIDVYQFVEVGAGLGDLTNRLLNCGRLLAFEVDKDLTTHLTCLFEKALQNGSLRLEFSDILEFWHGRHLLDCPYVLVSNLPYCIATAVVLRALRDSHCRALVVMTQREVAQKFCADVSDSTFCALSVLAQSVGECALICNVDAAAFSPQPKVMSGLFRIVRKAEELPSGLEALLRIAFNAPRKTLHNNLSKHYSLEQIKNAFCALGIPTNTRPHQINTPQYHQLTRILQKGE